MDNVYKYLKHNSKRILSIMLAFAILAEPTLSAYANVATYSNMKKPVVVDSFVESPDPDFDSSTYDGIPFYFDENGNKIYDEANELADYVKPEYQDIADTFEEYPLTTIDYRADGVAPYVVGVDDAALGILAVTLAAYGVYVGGELIGDFASKHFEPWVRSTYRNNSSVMENLQDWLSAGAGTAFTGMLLFQKTVGDFLNTGTWGESSVSFKSLPTITNEPYPFYKTTSAMFLKSYSYKVNSTRENHYSIYAQDKSPYRLDSLYVGTNSERTEVYCPIYVDSSNSSSVFYSETSQPLRCYYMQYDFIDNYYVSSSVSTSVAIPASVALRLGYVVYKNKAAAESHYKYGTTGGTVSSSDSTVDSYPEDVPVKKTWSSLRTNFPKLYNPSDTFNVPASSDLMDSLLKKIYASDDEAEVISNINSAWKITKNAGASMTSKVAHSNLVYVLSAVAASAGATLASSDIDEFINLYYGNYVDGTSAKAEEQAEEILNDFVVIEGGGENGEPDDDKGNNKYKLAKKLVTALGSFLLTKGFLEVAPDFKDSQITPNIEVDGASGADPVPDPEPTPNPTPTNPDSGNDTGSVDLSGVLGFLQKILDALGVLAAWANPLSLMDSLVQKLNLDAIKTSILSLPDAIAKSINLGDIMVELDLSGLFSDVILAMESLPVEIAKQIGSIKLFQEILPAIEILPDKLTVGFALPALFDGLAAVLRGLPSDFMELLPDSLFTILPGILTGTFGLTDGFSLSDALSKGNEALSKLPETLAGALGNGGSGGSGGDTSDGDESEDGETEDGTGLFGNFLNILMLLILIVIALLILFLNCLKFIFNIYQIPASTALFNDDVLRGLEFLKNLNVSFPGTSSVSLFDLLIACAYFVIFMSIIAMLRKKIDKFHV